MIAIYLLGHRVGNIDEPVLYVNHGYHNYDGQEVTKGVPDPFVESLVHDGIIVQIPLLHGRINNRLVKVLSVFDQTNKDSFNRQMLKIDEDVYGGDIEMKHILHRLFTAACDAKLRQDMNVEDEFFSAIENRDAAIKNRDKRIAEQDAQIEQNKAQLEQNKAQLEQKDAQLEQKDAQLEQKDKALVASAKAMKVAGMSIEQISAVTGLPASDIVVL